jgi:hypothetical protein
MAVWRAPKFNKVRQTAITIYRTAGFHTLKDHSAEWFAEGRRAQKAVYYKSTLTYPFLKPMLPQETGRRL